MDGSGGPTGMPGLLRVSLALTVISRLIGPSDVGKRWTMIMLEFIAVAHIKRAVLGSRVQSLNTYKHVWLFLVGRMFTQAYGEVRI